MPAGSYVRGVECVCFSSVGPHRLLWCASTVSVPEGLSITTDILHTAVFEAVLVQMIPVLTHVKLDSPKYLTQTYAGSFNASIVANALPIANTKAAIPIIKFLFFMILVFEVVRIMFRHLIFRVMKWINKIGMPADIVQQILLCINNYLIWIVRARNRIDMLQYRTTCVAKVSVNYFCARRNINYD
jgi:hypothetical protein